jgi:hypothetical protein
MKFLEKDLEQIIFESGRDSLREKGLPVYGKMFRQLRIGMYDGPQRKYFVPGQITIYELKKDQIGIASFLQSLNYVKGIQRYLEKKGKQEKYIINLVIIGKELDKTGSFCYIHNLLSIKNEYYDLESNLSESGEISFYTYEYTLDGLKFNYESEYVKNDEGF